MLKFQKDPNAIECDCDWTGSDFLKTRTTTKKINQNTTTIMITLYCLLHVFVWIMFTPKLLCNVLTRSVFPTIFCKQFCL